MKHHALALALSIAACTHITIYALLSLWSAPIPNNVDKSIPVTLILSPDAIASKATKQNKSSQSDSPIKSITTVGATEQSISSSKRNENNALSKPIKQTRKNNSIEQKKTASQVSRQKNQAASIKQLFTSTAEDQPAIQAIQTQKKETMSEYEIQLLNHLLSGQLYDDFHRLMKKTEHQDVSFTIQLSLFPNGAIKSAKVTSKNKDLPIEKLAVTAAYNASPYPSPPDEDITSDFTYLVAMTYSENTLR